MANRFEDVMARKSNVELLKIVTGNPDDYQPEGLEAARKEFDKRNLPAEIIESVKQEIVQEQKLKDDKANQSLGTIWKVLTFVLPGLIQIIFSGTFKADGYDRKAKELVKWTMYGFAFYVGVLVLISILDAVF